jgi:hypothetical protein
MGSLLACQFEVANRLVRGLGLTSSALSLPCRDLCQGLDRALLLARLTRLILSGRRASLRPSFPSPLAVRALSAAPTVAGWLGLGQVAYLLSQGDFQKRILGSSPSSHGSWLPFGPGGGGEPTSFFWATTPWFLCAS